MELIGALLGAIIGAIASFTLAEISKRKQEKDKILAALSIELDLNLEVADEILKFNSKIDFDSKMPDSWEWCDIIPFSDSAWTAVISGGNISKLNLSIIEPLSRSYAQIRRANYIAAKIQAGRYQPREGKEYTFRVNKVKVELIHALDLIKKMN
jgi:hypothetical protein